MDRLRAVGDPDSRARGGLRRRRRGGRAARSRGSLAPPAEPAEPAASGEEPAPAPAEGEWSLAEAAAPYAGTTINVLDEVTDLQPRFAELIPQFEEETGIDVEFSIEGHVDVIQKGEADLLAGRGDYDLVMVHDFQMGRVIDADVIEPIDQYLNNPDLKDPSVNFEDFIPGPTEASTIYDGQRICFPAWPYNYIYWVRNDFLTNPDEQAAFEEEYGYPLALPETMDQMYDIAEFFTRDAGETLAGETLSEPMYGFVQEGARLSVPWSPIYWLYMRQYGGGWFNEDGTPNFCRPENVEAMEFYKSLWEFSPPGAIEFSLIDIPVVMGEGRAASGLVWSDFVFSIDKQGGSPYAGNFAYAPPPAVGDGANRATLVALGCEVINKASENKEAAFLFSQWMASKATQDAWFDMEGRRDAGSPRLVRASCAHVRPLRLHVRGRCTRAGRGVELDADPEDVRDRRHHQSRTAEACQRRGHGPGDGRQRPGGDGRHLRGRELLRRESRGDALGLRG